MTGPVLRRVSACVAALLLGFVAVRAAAAPHVMVMSLGQDRAELLVNGTAIRSLRSGQTSPEGVTLVAATRAHAVVEVEGRRFALGLGQATVAAAVLKADRQGHFATVAHINGVAVPAIIDTGATGMALSTETARRIGIDYTRGQTVSVATAGGKRTGWRVNLATVAIGEVTLQNVEGVVLDVPAGDLPQVLVGMTFLGYVDMQRVGDTLTLTKRR
ncbi:MAG: TIGR02281 family clan AA aspartic protease [Burkholderiales bacterium]|jgi:aspartyl protease family protein|nr:TIGR02281 family clan AA aspartic protease [Burkholderiales bacterium]